MDIYRKIKIGLYCIGFIYLSGCSALYISNQGLIRAKKPTPEQTAAKKYIENEINLRYPDMIGELLQKGCKLKVGFFDTEIIYEIVADYGKNDLYLEIVVKNRNKTEEDAYRIKKKWEKCPKVESGEFDQAIDQMIKDLIQYLFIIPCGTPA